jgi:hypothetical protein
LGSCPLPVVDAQIGELRLQPADLIGRLRNLGWACGRLEPVGRCLIPGGTDTRTGELGGVIMHQKICRPMVDGGATRFG